MAKNGWVDTSVALLQRDHEELGAALARTRRLTLDFSPPPGACPSWRELYEELALLEGQLMDHVHLENNNLFPRMLYR